MNLSQHEVMTFLKDVLHMIDVNPPPNNGEEKLQFLNRLIKSVHEFLPFQNITFQSLPESKRRLPTIGEVKDSILRGEGGLCWVMNSFMYGLLTALGYNAYLVQSCVSILSDSPNHVIVIVKDVVKEDDCFLVEVGFGFPTFEAVPLDFVTESPEYQQSFLTFKFKYRKEDDMYIRLHKSRKDKFSDFPTFENGWCHACYFQIKEDEYEKLANMLGKNVYTNPRCLFWSSIRAVRWLDGKTIAVKYGLLLVEDSFHKLHPKKLEKPVDTENALKKYFPMLSPHVVEEAIKHWICIKDRK